jgi:hypothetical protein
MSSFNPLTGSLVEPEDDFIRLMESCLQSPTAASRQFSSLFSPSDAFNGSGGLSRYGSLNSNGSHHHNGLNGHGERGSEQSRVSGLTGLTLRCHTKRIPF